MSNNDTEFDDTITIDDAGITTLESAVDSLLDQIQTYLQYPYDASNNPTNTPSTTLDYRFNAEIEVSLDTSWSLFGGLTLTNLTLQTQVAKAKGRPGSLYVSLSATAVIGETTCIVTGSIPRLSSETAIDFILQIETENEMDMFQPSALVSNLTNDGYTFKAVTDKLDSNVSDQIEGGPAGVSFTGSAWIIVTRSKDGTFFLKQLSFALESDIYWDLIPNHLQLTEVSLAATFGHDMAASPWTADLGLTGIFILNNVELTVTGEVALGDTSAIELSVSARAFQEITPEIFLQQLLGPEAKSKYTSTFQLPPSVTYPGAGEDQFSASLSLSKDSLGWFVKAADVILLWDEMSWYPIPALDVSIEALYFHGTIRRDPSKAIATPSASPLLYTAAFGGSLTLAGFSTSVVVTYQSATSFMTLTCTVDDRANVSLQDIASDALINPPSMEKAHNLNAEAFNAPAPDSVPVDLSWCNSKAWRTNTICILTFDNATMTRAQFKADFNVNWQITSSLRLTNLGIFFDISNPISDDLPSTVKGYVYGQVVLANSVQMFAFVAGVKQPAATEFAVSLTVSYRPQQSIGIDSQTVISDPKFIGQVIDTSGWSFPDSFPSTASVAQTVTSVDAQMVMRIKQMPDPAKIGNYLTSIASMQASLAVSGNWVIFGNVSLTQVYLSVNVFPASAANNNRVSYNAGLAGLVSASLSTVDQTIYNVFFVATIAKSVSQQTTFTVSVMASYTGQEDANVPLATFLKMPVTGLDQVDVANDPSSKTIPSELAAQPSTLLSGSVAACSMAVSKVADSWVLKEISASITQADTWVVISSKLTVSQSSVQLRIADPRQSSRTISFVASTLVTIGNLVNISASMVVALVGGNEDTLTITLSISNFQAAINTLIGTNIEIPSGTPALDTYTASLTITCKKGNDGFRLVTVNVSAVSTVQWDLGPFSINGLKIAATFDQINTSMSTKVSFLASGLIASVPIQLLIAYVTQPQTLIFTITSGIQPTQVVDAFVSGGLGPQSSLSPPSITADTGLDGYGTQITAFGSVIFKKTTVWSADSLSFNLTSGKTQWILVNDILVAKNLTLSLVLSGLSTGTKVLSVNMGLDFEFAARPPPTGQKGTMKCVANATSKKLVITVDTSQCTLPQFLYTVTAGFWNPPDSVGLPSISPGGLLKAIILTISWDDGSADFKAVLRDWILTDKFPRLGGMKEPRLEASISKTRTGGFKATGQLAGTAMSVSNKQMSANVKLTARSALGVEVPLSFDLATGPFRVCGVDVKEAYEMAKRLYNILKDLKTAVQAAEDVAAVVSELAEFAGVAEAAPEVAAALAAAGVAAGIIDLLMDQYFSSSSSGGPKPSQDDPGSNSPGSNPTSQQCLVLGGKALSPGPAGETVDLVVFPKDKFGFSLQPFDISKMLVGIVAPENQRGNIVTAWTSVVGGCETSFTRFSTSIPMWVEYRGPPTVEADFQNVIQPQTSVFSLANSDIEFPETIGCLSQGLVVFKPKDQYSQPRLGPNATPPLLISSFTRLGGGSSPVYDSTKGFSIRNDSLLLPFCLVATGTYRLGILEASNSQGSPRSCDIIGVNALDPAHCVASGEGLCSGVTGTSVPILINLKDQVGNVYTSGNSESLHLVILLHSSPVPDQELNWSLTAGVVTCYYTRPAVGSYSIEITISNVIVGDSVVNLISTESGVTPSVTKSQCSITSSRSAVGDHVTGRIVTFDSLGQRWYLPQSSDSPIFKVVLPLNVFDGLSLVDHGDGTYTFQAVAKDVLGAARISVVSATDETQVTIGSPLSIEIVAARVLSFIVAYGSGLAQGHDEVGIINLRGMDQYGAAFPVNLGVNCKLIAMWQNKPIAAIAAQSSTTTFSYQKSSINDDPVLVVLRSIAPATFLERAYLVTCTEPSALDATQSFVIWNSLVTSGVSTATLYAINASGKRIFQGGDFVQITSAPNSPMILTNSVIDNLDGSYRLKFSLPNSNPAGTFPQLQVSINRQPVQSSPFQFPLQPLPAIAATLSGAGISTAMIGIEQNFFITCLDTSGQVTAQGFHSASAFLLQTGTDTPSYVVCAVGAMTNGTVLVRYTVPASLGTGKYLCHVFVNSEPIASSLAEVEVSNGSIDDVDEACQITRYTLAEPAWRWMVSKTPGWTVNNSQPNNTMITGVGPTDPTGGVQSFALNLPVTDEWFENGFMLSFDICIPNSGSIKVGPLKQPANVELSMTWKPTSVSAGSCRWSSKDATTGLTTFFGFAQTDRLAINYPSSSSIAFFYLVSPDKSQYTLAAFQAGQFITRKQWNRTNDIPKLGFTIERLSADSSTVAISNVITIPSYFRHVPKGPPSAIASSTQGAFVPANVLDGNPETMWQSELSPQLLGFPHSITIDLKAIYSVSALTYTPGQHGTLNGRMGQFTIQLSTDGQNWPAPIVSGSSWQDVDDSNTTAFAPTNAQYVRVTALTEAGNRNVWVSASEIKITYVGSALESPSEIDFSAPWAAKYVATENNSGTLDNRGLVMDGQHNPNGANWCWIHQLPVPDFGHSISVFSLDIPASYDFTPPRGPPIIANIKFAGFSFNPNTGRWVDWTDKLEDVAPANLVVGSGTKTNVVYCISGKRCATIFANGLFQLTATAHFGVPMSDLYPPELFSWWTDVVWHKMRVCPPLKLQS